MRHLILIALVAVGATAWLPADAWSQGRLSAGAVLWRHDTNLDVERATDFDGTDDTAGQIVKDWDVLGSGAGVRFGYDFPKLAAIYGEVGATQATVRDKDVVDPNQDVGSLGLNDGAYFAVGARIGADFSSTGNLFWAVDGMFSSLSTALDEDVNTSWDYDESRLSVGGRIGVWTKQVGFFSGVRLVTTSADLSETDVTNAPGQQTRTTELGRDGAVDILLGAQTKGSEIAGFTEVGLVGTFSVNAGLTLRF